MVLEPHDPGLGINHLNWHLQDLVGLGADRQDRRVGLPTFLAQGGQHDVHDRLPIAQHAAQGIVELTGIVAIAGRDEFVIEAELIEEFAQHRVVVVREAFVLAERIGDPGQRMAEVGGEQPLVGDVVRHLAQAVHVIAEGDEPRRRATGQRFIGAADQRGAQHFLEGADMRQARGAIAGLEQHRAAIGFPVRIPLQQLARFFEGPSLGYLCGGKECFIGHARPFRAKARALQGAIAACIRRPAARMSPPRGREGQQCELLDGWRPLA